MSQRARQGSGRPPIARDAAYEAVIELFCSQRDAWETLVQQCGALLDDGIRDCIRQHVAAKRDLSMHVAHFRHLDAADAPAEIFHTPTQQEKHHGSDDRGSQADAASRRSPRWPRSRRSTSLT
jgi:hypothetical protein